MVRLSTKDDLTKALALRSELASLESGLSLAAYLDRVVINSSPTPTLFQKVREPWQTEIWTDLDRAIEAVAFGEEYDGPHGFWVTMPRGHDKTGAIGRRVNWLLSQARRPVTVVCAAADQDQAGLITESMRTEKLLNPWIQVDVTSKRAKGPKGQMKVLSADAPTTWGLGADVYICDEITWWKKRDLWEPLLTAWRKRKGAVFIVITNAGVIGSWQYGIYQTARSSTDWKVYEVPEGTWLAGWMDKAKIDQDRKVLPRGICRRVFDNRWIDPGEESGYLSREEVLACEEYGKFLGLRPMSYGVRGIDYIMGVDYGPKRDRTVLTIVHHDSDRRVVIDQMDIWQGTPEHPVQISRVDNWMIDMAKRFNRPLIVCDPYQLEETIQRFEYHHPIIRFEARGGKSNYEMASTLRSLIVNKQLVWYPGAGDLLLPDGRIETFVDELVALVLKPMPYGYRFDTKDNTLDGNPMYHDDRAVAVGMAALYAARNPPAPKFGTVPVLPQPGRPVLPELRPAKVGRGLWGIGV